MPSSLFEFLQGSNVDSATDFYKEINEFVTQGAQNLPPSEREKLNLEALRALSQKPTDKSILYQYYDLATRRDQERLEKLTNVPGAQMATAELHWTEKGEPKLLAGIVLPKKSFETFRRSRGPISMRKKRLRRKARQRKYHARTSLALFPKLKWYERVLDWCGFLSVERKMVRLTHPSQISF